MDQQSITFHIHGELGRKLCRILGWLSCFAGSQLVPWRQSFAIRLSRLAPFLCVTRLCCAGYATMRSTSVLGTRRCKWFRRRQVLKARRPGAFTLPLAWQDIYGLANLKCSRSELDWCNICWFFFTAKNIYGFYMGFYGIGKLRHDNYGKTNTDLSIENLVNKGWVQLSIWNSVQKKLIMRSYWGFWSL